MDKLNKHARDLAWETVCNARRVLGNGWSHVSDDIRWGLVCANILSILILQDAMEGDDEHPKARAADLTYAIWHAAGLIKLNGWKRPW